MIKVVFEALKEQMTIQDLSSKFVIHPNQISTWKSDFLSNASAVFDGKGSKKKEKVNSDNFHC